MPISVFAAIFRPCAQLNRNRSAGCIDSPRFGGSFENSQTAASSQQERCNQQSRMQYAGLNLIVATHRRGAGHSACACRRRSRQIRPSSRASKIFRPSPPEGIHKDSTLGIRPSIPASPARAHRATASHRPRPRSLAAGRGLIRPKADRAAALVVGRGGGGCSDDDVPSRRWRRAASALMHASRTICWTGI